MKQRSLLHAGVIGFAVAALCCFTPILVVLLGAVGLSAITGYLDLVLMPALAIFAGLTVYALWRRGKSPTTEGVQERNIRGTNAQ